MFLQALYDTALLFGLGLGGWFLLSRIKVPAPEIMGPIILIGAFRALHIELPPAPGYMFPVAQVIIGIFVGSMLDRDSVRQLKTMALSALVVVTWALSMIVIIGFFLNRYSAMDPPTALLSASMGGLPEISVLAVASGASAAVVIVMQMIRMLGSIMLFPAILERIENRTRAKNRLMEKKPPHSETLPPLFNGSTSSLNSGRQEYSSRTNNRQSKNSLGSLISGIKKALDPLKINRLLLSARLNWPKLLSTAAVAAGGGFLLHSLNVPAGLMVGSTFAVAAASVAGMPVSKVSNHLLSLLLVAIGITLADNITPDMLQTMAQVKFLVPILVATSAMFLSSFGTAWLIFRITDWDFPTSFLAAAPGGFTVMTALAIKHGVDPFKVSMIHLCRLLAIKMFIPLVFMLLM